MPPTSTGDFEFGLLIVLILPVIRANGNLVDNLWITLSCVRAPAYLPVRVCARPRGRKSLTARAYGGG